MKNFWIIIFSIIALAANAQEQFIFINNNSYDHFTTDILSNVYAWENTSLDKYSSEGKLISHYKSNSLGNITSVDASIPSKILVFFQESGSILFLDDNLVPIGNTLNLFDMGLYSISLVSHASVQSIVLYDHATQNLYITDLNLNITHTTPCNFSTDFTPSLLCPELDKGFLLIDQSYGLFLFDKYGTFDKRFSFLDVNAAKIQKGSIFFLKGDILYQYEMNSLNQRTILSNMEDMTEFCITYSYIFFLDASGVLYRFPTKK